METFILVSLSNNSHTFGILGQRPTWQNFSVCVSILGPYHCIVLCQFINTLESKIIPPSPFISFSKKLNAPKNSGILFAFIHCTNWLPPQPCDTFNPDWRVYLLVPCYPGQRKYIWPTISKAIGKKWKLSGKIWTRVSDGITTSIFSESSNYNLMSKVIIYKCCNSDRYHKKTKKNIDPSTASKIWEPMLSKILLKK